VTASGINDFLKHPLPWQTEQLRLIYVFGGMRDKISSDRDRNTYAHALPGLRSIFGFAPI
jgi:hypothetical protein